MASPTRDDPGTNDDGYEQEGESHRSTVPLDLEGDGEADDVIAQQVTGADNVAGGGEFPDRDTPPRPPAKGYDPEREPGGDAPEGDEGTAGR